MLELYIEIEFCKVRGNLLIFIKLLLISEINKCPLFLAFDAKATRVKFVFLFFSHEGTTSRLTQSKVTSSRQHLH